MRPRARMLSAVASLVAVAACSDLAIDPAIDRITVAIANPSFAGDIEPILKETCASSSACHSGPNTPSTMDLDPGQAYASIVNVPTKVVGAAYAPAPWRVRPSFPDSSLFYRVLSEDSLYRLGYYRMPLTRFPLPAPIVATIRNWIANGAPNN